MLSSRPSGPGRRPGSAEPPCTNTLGTLQRTMPIIRPGRFLSQAPMPKMPSHWWPRTEASTLSAISSREISEKRMPECAIVSPSLTDTTGHSCGVPPPA